MLVQGLFLGHSCSKKGGVSILDFLILATRYNSLKIRIFALYLDKIYINYD